MGKHTHQPQHTASVKETQMRQKMTGHSHVQERWEHPEEEYYEAKHGPDASSNGKKGSDGEDLEIDAGPKGGSKVKRMHPFGLGIRQVLSQCLSVPALSQSTEPCKGCCGHFAVCKESVGEDDELHGKLKSQSLDLSLRAIVLQYILT